MKTRVLLAVLTIMVPLTALAQEPGRFKAVAELAYQSPHGKDVMMPQVLLKYFKVPEDYVNAIVREVMIPQDGLCCGWKVKILETPNTVKQGPRKRLLLVSCYPGEIRSERGGKISAPGGEDFWLIDEKGESKGTCHWVEGHDPEELDPNSTEWSLAEVCWDLKAWVRNGGDPFRK